MKSSASTKDRSFIVLHPIMVDLESPTVCQGLGTGWSVLILNVTGMFTIHDHAFNFIPDKKAVAMKTTLIVLTLLALPTMVSAQDALGREYYPDGQVSKVYWNADDMVRFVSFHENGKVKEKGGYIDGRAHGRWVQYNANGRRTCRARFDKGSRTGVWLLQTLDGVSHRLSYKDNKLVRGEEYDAQGVLLAVRDEF